MAADFFCLDVGETKIKVADVQKKANLLEALSMGMEKMDPLFYKSDTDEVVKGAAGVVTQLLKQLKVSKKNVQIIVPDTFSYNQFIEVPRLNEKELFSAIKYQADQFIPMPLNDVNLDIEIVYEDVKEKKMLTLIAASPKKIIERIQQLAENCGLIPETVETETSAVSRFLSSIFPKKVGSTSGHLYVNLQPSSCSVYFFEESQGLVTYCHNFQVGLSLFLKEIQVNQNIDPSKAEELLSTMGLLQGSSYNLQTILAPSIKKFMQEIEKSVTEISNKKQAKIDKIYLLNEAMNFKGLDQLLSKYFGIQAEYLNPYSLFEKNNVVDYFKNDLVYFPAAFGGSLT